jgi:hypothetical protein
VSIRDETMAYRVVFRRHGRDIETLYWNGSLDETRDLARRISSQCEAEEFRRIDFTDTGAEIWSEECR